MTWVIFACTAWGCAPEPLRSDLPSLERCEAVAAQLEAVPGVRYECKREGY